MKVLVKPVVIPTKQELLYEALGCPEQTCGCNGSCRNKAFDTGDKTDDILF